MKNIRNNTSLYFNAVDYFKNIVHQISSKGFSMGISLILFSTLLLSGCEDFLTVEPYSTIAPESFLNTEDNAELALIGVYNMLNAGDVNGVGNSATFRRGMLYMLNGGTDEGVGAINNPDYTPYLTYTYSPTDTFGKEAWLFLNTGITRANYLIESIDGITFQNPERKEQIKAEARFLRAVYYQYLAWMYGAVPLRLTISDDYVKDIERNSLEDVYSAIEADLMYAYTTLNPVSNIPGSANKWSAAGYLSKMYTYLASCKENNVGSSLDLHLNHFDWVNSSEMYQKAYDVNSAIIGNKSLTPEYFHLFRSEKKASTYNEVLFGVEAGVSLNVVIIYLNAFIPQGNVTINGGGSGWMRPGMDLYNKYDRINDSRFKNNITGILVNNISTLQTETLDGTPYYVPTALPANMVTSYRNISIGKWRYPIPGSKALPFWGSDCNLQLIRYADILLLQAELEYKHKNNETAARTYLAKVRERAVQYDQAKLNLLTTSYHKADFMEELMDERSRELCFETWRRIDLIRTGKLLTYYSNDNLTLTGHFYQNQMSIPKSNLKPYHIWFPIPISELSTNKKMIQNSGY